MADNLFCICSPNFFILDEPTNHLDVETVEALGKALTQFNVSLYISYISTIYQFITSQLILCTQ